ncbi:MAG: 6-phosphofructokinase, partial [Caldilineaceae bacterium]|nr:6-phosphofructokinase [Caldilineaceae bacterium]
MAQDTREISKIALSTGGGDAPGLNAVIRAAVLAANRRGWQSVGIRDGYNGLLMPERYDGAGVVPLTTASVHGITHLGGTILGTTNRGNPLRFPIVDEKGEVKEIDRSDELVARLTEAEIDAVIAIGGDGSLGIANVLAQKGVRVIGVPKTIDNDLDRTVATFGFDTAVSFATECIDRLHTTAESHDRVIVVEVMGRYAGWIALHAGVAATADVILIPEIPFDLNKVVEKINDREEHGRHFSIVVVAEGATSVGGALSVVEKAIGREQRLGGAGAKVAAAI